MPLRLIDSKEPLVCFVVVLISALAGCQSTTTKQARTEPYIRKAPAADAQRNGAQPNKQDINTISNTDPCAMRLHDICGALLLYYQQNHTLPKRLDDLANSPLLEGPDALNLKGCVMGVLCQGETWHRVK